MSDFIPPLMPSSPPPMPDFDDVDDDEFGMVVGYNIGDLDLPGTASGNVILDDKHNKMLDNRKLEMNGSAIGSNWKCEEQDSASQDSGLCMASHSSEGMSPLPQSDDEEKQIDVSCQDNSGLHMKHDTTVVFNQIDDQIDDVCSGDLSGLQHSNGESNVLVNDTGQSEDVDMDSINSVFPAYGNYEDASSCTKPYVVTNASVGSCNISADVESTANSLDSKPSNSIIKDITLDENTGADSIKCSESSNVRFEESINGGTINITSSPDSAERENSVSFKCAQLCDSNNALDSQINDGSQSVCYDNSNQTYIEHLNEHDFDDDDDDFGNFACVTIPNNCDSVSNCNNDNSNNCIEVQSTCKSVIPNSNDVDNYSDLVSSCSNVIESTDTFHSKPFDCETVLNGEPFTEFSSNDEEASTSILASNAGEEKNGDKFNVVDDDDDDFDDFSDFTQSTNISSIQQPEICVQLPKSVLQENTLEFVFPKLDDAVYSDNCIQQLECGPVWKHLCPLENSPALTFQWSNSRAHNRLLAALSIDSRNILFGPNWNANIPRFAANLGSNPLQPIKAAEGSSNSLSSQHPSDEPTVVPDAHFDWVGSGLTNPLDSGTHSALLDLEIISTFDNLTTTNNSITGKSPSDGIEQLNVSKHSIVVEKAASLSAEAESIVSLLPDLSFMRKTYIEFLINKD